ncbi:MAG: GTP-binding protein, partial [Lachnospiraceae bacterium]|nr:GTP-binding protein [Lachnospiraceae bacterium]
MGSQAEKTEKGRVCAGLLAHVDAGKTTLAEGILYLTGRIRSLGRVDHQDAFFDNFEMERARGITIFSKQAQVEIKARTDLPDDGTLSVTLLDTPGHVDFSAEMERTLQVLDYAILVISGADEVQSHVETLWRLLARYEIPVFLFVNKMDQPGTDRESLLAGLQAKLDPHCVDFNQPLEAEAFQEALAMCDDDLLEAYLSGEAAGAEEIQRLIAARKVFPCCFGSALKLRGVEELLEGLRLYAVPKAYPAEFGARVYKISRDAQGNRLTHMKITGGTLRVKDVLTNRRSGGSAQTGAVKSAAVGSTREIWEEKVNQIRILSGPGYEDVSEVQAGTVCEVTGLTW